MQSVKRRHFPQTLIKLKRNNNQVVSLIYIRYKNYGVRFSRCWVPTAPSAPHMEKLQALLIKEKSFTVVCFPSQLGTTQKHCRSSHVILALCFHTGIKLWQV